MIVTIWYGWNYRNKISHTFYVHIISDLMYEKQVFISYVLPTLWKIATLPKVNEIWRYNALLFEKLDR